MMFNINRRNYLQSKYNGYIFLLILLLISHLLLPIERGFPSLYIGGVPILYPWLILSIVFFWTHIPSFRLHIDRYVILNFIFLFVSLLSVFMLEGNSGSTSRIFIHLYKIFSNFMTYIVMYWVIVYFLSAIGRAVVIRTTLIIGLISAVITFFEGHIEVMLPFYKQYYQALLIYPIDVFIHHPSYRAMGTLGNPILASAVMVLMIPYTFEIHNKFIRMLFIIIFVVSGMGTISRTFTLGTLIVLCGITIFKWVHKRFIPIIIIITLSSFFFTILLNSEQFTKILNNTIGERDNWRNITIRWEIWTKSVEVISNSSTWAFLFGNGINTSDSVTELTEYADLKTLDNTYLTLLYERGFIGLVTYLTILSNIVMVKVGNRLKNPFTWGAIALWGMGFSFSTLSYTSFNILYVISIAILQFDHAVIVATSESKG